VSLALTMPVLPMAGEGCLCGTRRRVLVV